MNECKEQGAPVNECKELGAPVSERSELTIEHRAALTATTKEEA